MNWTSLLLLIGAGILVFIMFNTIRKRPQAFSAENLGKSAYVLGILALCLIAFIGVMIFLLRQGT